MPNYDFRIAYIALLTFGFVLTVVLCARALKGSRKFCWLELIVYCPIIIMIFAFERLDREDRAYEIECSRRLHDLSVGILFYAEANGRRMPPQSGWYSAIKPYLRHVAQDYCPDESGGRGYYGLHRLPSLKDKSISGQVILLGHVRGDSSDLPLSSNADLHPSTHSEPIFSKFSFSRPHGQRADWAEGGPEVTFPEPARVPVSPISRFATWQTRLDLGFLGWVSSIVMGFLLFYRSLCDSSQKNFGRIVHGLGFGLALAGIAFIPMAFH